MGPKQDKIKKSIHTIHLLANLQNVTEKEKSQLLPVRSDRFSKKEWQTNNIDFYKQ